MIGLQSTESGFRCLASAKNVNTDFTYDVMCWFIQIAIFIIRHAFNTHCVVTY